MSRIRALALMLCPLSLPAQSVITRAGYSLPADVSVAPGQVITLFADGVGKSLTQRVRAPAGPWPTTLAGISVTLNQYTERLIPILEVRPVSTCMLGVLPDFKPPCAALAAITVQMPFDLVPLCILCGSPFVVPPARLFVSENGQTGAALDLNTLRDQFHILTACDVLIPSGQTPINLSGLPCPPMVTHADGTLVSGVQPALPGEPITAWAVGLGYTNLFAIANTGQPSTTPLPLARTPEIDYSFRPNALPVRPRPTVSPAIFPNPFAVYAGLAPGFVGLYQINFSVPPAPAGTQPCTLQARSLLGSNAIESNLTVSFGGEYSFDGAGICVAIAKP